MARDHDVSGRGGEEQFALLFRNWFIALLTDKKRHHKKSKITLHPPHTLFGYTKVFTFFSEIFFNRETPPKQIKITLISQYNFAWSTDIRKLLTSICRLRNFLHARSQPQLNPTLIAVSQDPLFYCLDHDTWAVESIFLLKMIIRLNMCKDYVISANRFISSPCEKAPSS